MKRAIAGLWIVIFGILAPRTALGCLWDTDTLGNEAKGLPEVVQVITGRFERNPPLFYEMRLKRVTAELDRDPGLLNDYDDAAVACDRLSRDDEAIAWVQKKRAHLEKADGNAPEIKEHWYHYYANIGTFRVHRWLRSGADLARIAEVRQARNEIAKAIEINPNAHFGREKVQLAFMDWMIAPGKERSSPARDITAKIPGTYNREQTLKGLCGLIVLGNAWESLDAFVLLTDTAVLRKPTVQYLAALRCKELLSQGHHSLHPEYYPDPQMVSYLSPARFGVSGDIHREIEEQYRELRAEAEAWQKRRTDYMMARLGIGRHPDADPTFWSEWKETPPPSLDVSWYRYLASRIRNPIYIYNNLGWFLLPLVVLGIGASIAGRRRRLRKARLLEKLGTAA